jgi:serine O-acetyltransferase
MSAETTFEKIKADLQRHADRERRSVTIPFALRMFLLTPGFQFVFAFRVMQAVRKVPVVGRLLRRIVWWANCRMFSSEIAIVTDIAGGLYVPHPYGIVVGSATIGRDVTILQNVTIGKRGDDEDDPVIEDGVELYAGAVVIGPIRLGRNCKIGANSVVISDVPEGATAVGSPARVIMPKEKPNVVKTA